MRGIQNCVAFKLYDMAVDSDDEEHRWRGRGGTGPGAGSQAASLRLLYGPEFPSAAGISLC
jgi:hypothetical protein